jgi:5'(3')-deoxyribonucleotidase
MKLFEVRAEYKIFVDLDGVLSNLDKFVQGLIGVDFESIRGPEFTQLLARYRKAGATFFDRLEPMPDANVIWSYIAPHKPDILTATGPERVKATAEKIRWVYDHLNGFDQIHCVASGKQKYQYAAPNHILIDDTPINVKLWSDAGGIGILHRNAHNTIQELKGLGL